MNRAYANIAFTHTVKAMQAQLGSREEYADFEDEVDQTSGLTIREVKFIETRDSFYQATVSETGWPYVQHRGGPEGFLKVLDNKSLGFADLSGNLQYLSAGNLVSNDRIALIMVDYLNRRRLKLFGRARLAYEAEEPELLARIRISAYTAKVERAFIIKIEAWSWNCAQHITPRFKENEVKAKINHE
jgi:hypothetical protein